MRRCHLVLVAALVSAAPSIHAAEQSQHRLAFSKRLGVEILAGMQNGHWCREALDLEVRAQDRQLFIRDEFTRLMSQVGKLVEKDCSEAETALLKGMSADGSAAIYQGKTSKADRWVPHPLNVGAGEQQATSNDAQEKAIAKEYPPSPSVSKSEPHQASTAVPQSPAPAATTPGNVSQDSIVPLLPKSAALTPLPRDVDYASAMLRMVKDKLSLAQNDDFLRCWAEYRFEKEFSRFRRQEFKLQPVLKKAQEDLAAALAGNDGQHITVVITANFDRYDFKTQQFPISLKAEKITLRKNCHARSDVVPNAFMVKVPDLDAITGLPMEKDAAQAFVAKRTRYGSVNRRISIAMMIKVDRGGFVEGAWGQMETSGTIENVAIFADSDAKQPLYRMASAQLERRRSARAAEKAALAEAEERRKAEQRRRLMLAQRDRYIQALSSAPASVKLANWISDGQIDIYTRLNNLRTARAAALVSGKPVDVSMLIQVDDGGRNNVGTKWPGMLKVTVGDGQPDLRDSGWYLVQGLLTVPEGNSVPPAQLLASKVFNCAEPKCADATDPETIVDRKLASLAASN